MTTSTFREETQGDDLFGLLQRAQRERFFGQITFQFQDGDLVMTRIEQTCKPKDVNRVVFTIRAIS